MTIIITGANRGLGYETTKALAADRDRTLVLAGRDLASLVEAAERIQSETGNMNLTPLKLDLADLASVRGFNVAYRQLDLPPLKSIICNAGISMPTVGERSPDGYELVFATNHLGHFLLVNLLLDRLEPPARVIFVSSGAHDPKQANGYMQPPRYVKAEWLAYPDMDPELPADGVDAGGQAYATSKLCNMLCAYELDRRLKASGLSTAKHPLTVNAFDPGLMAGTGLGRYERGLVRFMWYYLMPWGSRLMGFGRTTKQSGADLAYLVSAPELVSVSGKFFDGREVITSSKDSYDLNKASDLWQTSIELSNLEQSETILPF
jgi:light-dependent protochlorophyllide reductase